MTRVAGKFVKELIMKGSPKGLSFLFSRGGNIMVKMKAGGIVLGGIAAYLILSKGISAMERGIRNICVAHEWKNYYKYGKDGNMMPPGYASHVRQINNNEERVTESPEQMEANKKQAQQNASNKGVGAQFAEAIVKAISDAFGGEKEPEEASEEDICPENCADCDVKECPFENCKFDGQITEWENHKPVAGRYPWNDGRVLEWRAYEKVSIKDDDKSAEVNEEKNEDETDPD